jgi:hypothetical protein
MRNSIQRKGLKIKELTHWYYVMGMVNLATVG